ncbi:MAG: thiamine ABC transporter substrate-binding protein [Nocardioides sp.]
MHHTTRRPRPRSAARTRILTTALASGVLVLAGCSLGSGSESAEDGAGPEGSAPREVVVASHDSWNMSKKVLKAFTDQTGFEATVQPAGDAGALTNKLVLTKGSPIADVVYGVDNTFASRAVEEGVLTEYAPEANPGEVFEPQDEEAAAQLTPVDYSDVCVNVDDTWFADNDLPAPTSFDDLTDPRYQGLFVTPAPSTSSPGLAFLLATVAEYGEDGWADYWQQLVDNDVKVTAGWSDAYQVDFTAGGGSGDRPIVLSYASSPPFTIPEGGDEPTTSAVLDTCFRQVEYAAVLDGAANVEGARAFVDFMTGREFQEALPDQMYVFPVDPEATLPDLWADYAVPAEDPATLPEDEISASRSRWLETWADIAQ